MDWLLFTLVAITSRAMYSIAIKVLGNKVKVSSITHALLLTACAGILSLTLSPLLGEVSFTGLDQVWLVVLIMIVSQAFANILFFKGLKDLDAGTAQVAFSSILVWGVVLSLLFLDSSFSGRQLFGMILLLVAMLLVQYRGGSIRANKGFFLIILSAMLFAGFQVTSASLSNTLSSSTYLLLAYFGPSIVVGVLYFRTIKSELVLLTTQIKNTLLNTFFASGTSLMYFIFSYFAYQHAPDRGVVVVLLTSQVMLSIIFGILFLRERNDLIKKLIAGALAFGAGILIKG